MIIKKIHIENFGKLSDFRVDFSDFMNLVFAPNESGKTTLLDFIKYIFYGSKIKKQKEELYFREKYMPWNSMPMSGSIELEHNSVQYVIYRSEGMRNGGKKLSVANPVTGEVYPIDNPGMFFFGTDENTFSSTCFVKDTVMPATEFVSSFSGFDLEEKDYYSAKKSIEEKIMIMTSLKRKESRASIINSRKIKALSELAKYEKQIGEIGDLNLKKENLKKQLTLTEEEIADFTAQKELMQNHALYIRHQKLKEYIVQEEKNISVLSGQLSKSTDEKNTEPKTESSPGVFGRVKRITVVLCLICLLTVCVLFGCDIISLPLMAICSLSVISIGGLSVYTVSKKIKISCQSSGKAKNEILVKSDFADTLKDQIALSNERITKAKQEIQSIETSGKIDCFEGVGDKIDINCFTNEEIDDIINSKGKHREMLLCELTSVEIKTERLSLLKKEYENAEIELENILDEEKSLAEKTEIYRLSLDILETAYSKLKNSLIPNVTKRAYDIFSSVASNEILAIYTDEMFNSSVRVGNEFKDSKYLSAATRDLLYLSLRMAVCDLVDTNEKVPVFLDDILAFFDDERAKRMSDVISAMSETRQIIMCTCRNRDKMYFENNRCINIINM